jgi:hypothetical protein
MEVVLTNSQSSTTQQANLDPDTPLGVINLTTHTLITALINLGWPVNTAIDFGCAVGDESMRVVAALRQRIKDSITVQ